jgi:hypothetical protein
VAVGSCARRPLLLIYEYHNIINYKYVSIVSLSSFSTTTPRVIIIIYITKSRHPRLARCWKIDHPKFKTRTTACVSAVRPYSSRIQYGGHSKSPSAYSVMANLTAALCGCEPELCWSTEHLCTVGNKCLYDYKCVLSQDTGAILWPAIFVGLGYLYCLCYTIKLLYVECSSSQKMFLDRFDEFNVALSYAAIANFFRGLVVILKKVDYNGSTQVVMEASYEVFYVTVALNIIRFSRNLTTHVIREKKLAIKVLGRIRRYNAVISVLIIVRMIIRLSMGSDDHPVILYLRVVLSIMFATIFSLAGMMVRDTRKAMSTMAATDRDGDDIKDRIHKVNQYIINIFICVLCWFVAYSIRFLISSLSQSGERDTKGQKTRLKDRDPIAWNLTNLPSELFECATFILIAYAIGYIKNSKRGKADDKSSLGRTVSLSLSERASRQESLPIGSLRHESKVRRGSTALNRLDEKEDMVANPLHREQSWNQSANDMRKDEFLKTIQMFSHIQSRQFEMLLSCLETKTFVLDECICKQGEVGNAMYIIKSGSVWCSIMNDAKKLRRKSSGATRSHPSDYSPGKIEGTVVARLGAGEVFGELSLLKQQPRAANCISKSDLTVCYMLKGSDFLKVMATGPDSGAMDGKKRKKSITVHATQVMWSHRGDSLALATYASNLKQLYSALDFVELTGKQRKNSMVAVMESDKLLTPSWAVNNIANDGGDGSPMRRPSVNCLSTEEELEELESQQYASNGLYTMEWDEISGNISQNRAKQGPLGGLSANRNSVGRSFSDSDFNQIKSNLGSSELVRLSGQYQLDFLCLIGPELTCRDILQRLLLYLKKVIDCDEVVVSVPFVGQKLGKAVEVSSLSPTDAEERALVGIKRAAALSETFVFEAHAKDHPGFDAADPTMHEKRRRVTDAVKIVDYSVIAIPVFCGGIFRESNMFSKVFDGRTKDITGVRKNTNSSPLSILQEEPRFVIQLTRRATKPFVPNEMIQVEALARSVSGAINLEELLACAGSRGVQESHKCVKDTLNVKIKRIMNFKDLPTMLGKAKGTLCCGKESEIIVRMNVWPCTGSGCLPGAPSLLVSDKGKSEGDGPDPQYQSPRVSVEFQADGSIDVSTWIDSNCPISDLPLSSFVTFEVCESGQYTALAWCGCQLFDFEKRLIRGMMSLPLTMEPLPASVYPSELSSPTAGDEDVDNRRYLDVLFQDRGECIVYSEPWSACLTHKQHIALKVPEENQPTTNPLHNQRKVSTVKIEKMMSIDTLLAECCMANRLGASKAELVRVRSNELKAVPRALPLIVKSIDITSKSAVRTLHKTTRRWGEITVDTALLLLTSVDPIIRAFAVERLDRLWTYKGVQYLERDICTYMLQLTQALKSEPYHDSALSRFLLRRALRSPEVVGHALYWGLQAEMHRPEATERYGLLISIFLRHCGDYRNGIGHQCFFMQKLNSAQQELKALPSKKAQKEKMGKILTDLDMVLPDAFKLPLRGDAIIANIIPEKCRVMSSKMKPIWLTCKTVKEETYRVLFKAGDDLRQDQLTLQLLTVMDRLWKKHSLDLMMTPYGAVATGDEVGLIEIVPNANTVSAILACLGDESKPRKQEVSLMDAAMGSSMESKFSIRRWLYLKENDGVQKIEVMQVSVVENEYEQRAHFEKQYPLSENVQYRFMKSCAGYCVATYVLGIGDRHPSNLMVTSDGRFLHIDFGHFLGNFKTKFGYKRETAPFVLVTQFVAVFGGEESEEFKQFENLCIEAFNVLRANFTLLCSLFTLMISSGLPELRGYDDLKWLYEKLCPEKSDEQAAEIMRELIQESLRNERTRANLFAHLKKHYK